MTPFARQSGRNPARIAAEIDRFNTVNQQEARKTGVRWARLALPAAAEALSRPRP